MKFELHHGDCLDVLKTLEDSSVDAIVTDPPYGLGKEPDPVKVMAAWVSQGYFEVEGSGFMGKKWDAFVPQPIIWKEVFRVLKPGGHLLAFSGTRTQDWMAMSLRFAGFEIRDMIAWVYGSGFPKSLNVANAIHDAAIGQPQGGAKPGSKNHGKFKGGCSDENEAGRGFGAGPGQFMAEAGEKSNRALVESAQPWAGWGTALKPALEPITLARKPLIGTVAANVLEHGTGGLNIGACRVGDEVRVASYTSLAPCHGNKLGQAGTAEARRGTQCDPVEYTGRWPANFIHDNSEQVLALFPDSDGSGSARTLNRGQRDDGWGMADEPGLLRDAGTGSAARFFYCAKASRDDRDEGCGISGEWLDSLELIIHNDTFTNLKELSVWEIADQKAGLELNGAALPARVTFEAIASEKSDSVLSTLSYGNALTEKSLKGIRFTTSTGISKIIDLKTLSWLTHLPTNGYTADASRMITEIGLSHAESAALQSLLKAITTNGETAFLLGASNAAKTTPLPTNAKEWLREKTRGNIHSTVKPTDLMRYLCRLITPPGGIVLDPFTGSGSTGKAAMAEGFRFIGIEREAEYIEIARARISAEAEKPRQLSLF